MSRLTTRVDRLEDAVGVLVERVLAPELEPRLQLVRHELSTYGLVADDTNVEQAVTKYHRRLETGNWPRFEIPRVAA